LLKKNLQEFPPKIPQNPCETKDAQHLRDIFYPKGFTDKDIVALSGAHSVGACHADRSGFEGPWTDDKLKFETWKLWGQVIRYIMPKRYKNEKNIEKGSIKSSF
jgi:hypothetical protein